MKMYQGVIVGYGGMGQNHYTRLCKTDRVKYVGVYDIDEKRHEVAQADGIARAYSSLDEVLADATVDFILCATPNNFHKDISIAALRAGKAVICEKPVTMNSAELQEIMEVQKETGVLFTVHQNRRADRDYLLVRETVESGRLGNVFEIESRVTGSRGIPGGWRQYAVAGGGMMLDWGVHLIDQILQMFPDEKVTSIYCDMYHVAYDECDDGFRMVMKTSGGRTAMIEVGTSHFIGAPRWYCCGDRGAIRVNGWECSGDIVTSIDHKVVFEEEILYTKAGPTKTMAPRSKDTVKHTVLNPDDFGMSDYDLYYRNFAEVLDGTAAPRVLPEEAMRCMKVMEAAFESDRTGETVHTNI